MTVTEGLGSENAVYYDPYDFDIDADPYPVWRRLRDEAPLYYNEKYDFYAISRWDDVEPTMKDPARFSSAKGTLIELIKADIELPPGIFIMADPPNHTVYRGVLSRVFTPRKMNAIEPQVRALAAQLLDEHLDDERFDLIEVIGKELPMRVIGMLMGVPESDQADLRARIDESLHLESGEMPDIEADVKARNERNLNDYAAYLDWRVDNPSDDLMTDLVRAEFVDHTGVTRTLTREEILGYVGLLSSAGNETTTKLIGHTAKILADFPDQRRQIAADRSLVPQAVEEILRFEAPSPVNARYVTTDVEMHGQTLPAGSALVMINASANRDERHWGPTADQFDIHRQIDHHLSFGYGIHFCLGAALARMEGRVFLDEFISRFPDWSVDLDASVRSHTSTVRGWDKLELVLG